MTRLLPAVALGALLALVALVGVTALRPAPVPTPSERVDALTAELRCPDCQGLSVRDSPTSSAAEIRRQVGELVAGGATDAEVRAHFVGRYGEWILLAPSSPLPWLLPLGLAVGASAALIVWLSRGGERSAPPSGPTAEARRRLREEVDALDA